MLCGGEGRGGWKERWGHRPNPPGRLASTLRAVEATEEKDVAGFSFDENRDLDSLEGRLQRGPFLPALRGPQGPHTDLAPNSVGFSSPRHAPDRLLPATRGPRLRVHSGHFQRASD